MNFFSCVEMSYIHINLKIPLIVSVPLTLIYTQPWGNWDSGWGA